MILRHLVVFFVGVNACLAGEVPFADESVVLTAHDGVKLSAKWAIPSGTARAALVIVQGSGNVGTDGDVSGPYTGRGYKGQKANLSDQLAERLAREGIATLRYAKRGFEDQAQLANQTAPYLVRDARTALEAARARFPGAKSGFVGFSEGALVAALVAAETPVDALFLLSLPTRSIDDGLAFQFVQWPVELLARKLPHTANGELVAGNLALPFLGPVGDKLDQDHNGSLSLDRELIPAYREMLSVVLGMLSKPPFEAWYRSLRALPPFAQIAARVSAPVFLYQPLEDAQDHWSWVVADQSLFTGNAGRTQLRLFAGVGHAFAPMDGELGDTKTSGPFSPALLDALAADSQSLR
ncbi:MAG: alpha/beta hydrolase [Deltaproteobacteria bacterium]|nr:alpha/beta hydrolase [Deltaproteobacteria bacterium]